METEENTKAHLEAPEIFEAESSPPHLTPGVVLGTLGIIFLLLFAVWIVLSGRLDFFHLFLGGLSCGLVTLFSGDLLLPEIAAPGLLRRWGRFLAYIPWLLFQIFLANAHMLYLVFHPRMIDLIDPRIVRFRSILRKDLSLVTFANSITLTPGTITIYVSVDEDFKVHAIDEKCAESLPGEMETRVAVAMGEIP